MLYVYVENIVVLQSKLIFYKYKIFTRQGKDIR